MTDDALDTIVAVQAEQLAQQARIFEDHCEKQNRNLERIWEALEGMRTDQVKRVSKVEAAIGAALASLVVGLITYLATH